MGRYTVAVQSPQLCMVELLSLRSTSSIQVHTDHSMFSLIMIVALKEQDVDVLPPLLLIRVSPFLYTKMSKLETVLWIFHRS